MAWFLEAAASVLVVAGVVSMLLAATLGTLWEWRAWRWLARRIRGEPPPPPPRSLEQVAADVRRISQGFHRTTMRFAQFEGRRRSYDQVLGEAASMLEVDHLLAVLPPGPELDVERARLERVLAAHGILPHRTTGPGDR